MPPWYFWNLWQFLIGRPWAKCVTRSHQHGQNFAGPPNTLNHVPSRWLLRQWQIPFLGTIFPLLRKYSWNRFGRTSKLYMWRLDEPKLHAPWHNYGRFGYFSCSPSLLDVDFWIFSSFAVGIPKCSNIVFNFDCGCWSPALSSIFGMSTSVAAHTISSKGKLMLPQLAAIPPNMEVILSRRIIPLNRDAEKNTAFTLLHQCEFGCQSNQNIGEMNNADFLLKLTPFSNHFGGYGSRTDGRHFKQRWSKIWTWFLLGTQDARKNNGTCPCAMCGESCRNTYLVTIEQKSTFPWRGRSARALWKRWCRVRVDPPVTGCQL